MCVWLENGRLDAGVLSFALLKASETVLKEQTMSSSATTIFNCGVIINPQNTVYDRDGIGNLKFTAYILTNDNTNNILEIFPRIS
jgi:5-methylcytosine-specific restriction endonuclease McrBC regulatory subunit McrC